MIGERLPEVR
jgi:hypothetical protein